MKRILKWIGIVVCVLIALPLLGLLGVYGYYHHIVSAKPGRLAVKAAPGPLGTYVDPFIATGGFPWMCGLDTPAATVPFGMVRLGPDTRSIITNEMGLNRSGYFYGDQKIVGFSHTRLVGADSLEGGVFRIFPTVESRAEWAHGKDRFAEFSHAEELAFPGYYGVRLPKDDILVELTATPRVGVHRYTFHKDAAPHVLIDVTSAFKGKKCTDGAVKVMPETQEIEGKAREFGTFSGRYGGLDAYFVARFSRPFAAYGTLNGTAFTGGGREASGDDIGVDVSFENKGVDQVVEVRLALSYVSVANARKNLEAEAVRPFDDIVPTAKSAWEKRLSLIRVDGGTDRQRRIFYTCLYHAFQMPTVFTDVTGEYTGFDRAVHKAAGFQYYTDFSIWDTFRTVHPLYNLIARADERDMMVSLVEMAKAGGCLPRWPSGCGYTNCMIGTPADILVSEAYQKGIHDFDAETAYKAMRQTALTGKPEGTKFAGRDHLEDYLRSGYCPSDTTRRSAASTLEFSYQDYAIALLAQELGHTADATLFASHAKAYRNVWNPESQHFEPRDSNGAFPAVRNPLVLTYLEDGNGKYSGGYVEGSGEQWRWVVPYDAAGLISLFKSRDYFVSELEKYFAKANSGVGWFYPGVYYWHGNEPYIHSAYLFNAAGRPDLTQKWVRWILNTKYSDDYVGLDGNDDGGTLSAWYVFSALGFYPVAGTTRYELGAPLFEKAEMQIGDKTLKIIADNYAPDNFYVQQVTLNGVPLNRTYIMHPEIANGGELRFKMSSTPPPVIPATN